MKMSIDDTATAHEEMMREIALKHRKPELVKTGFCYNCGESVKQNANYCDVDCRLDHEKRRRK